MKVPVRDQFSAALDALIAQVQQDRTILAAILISMLYFGRDMDRAR